MKKPKTQTCLLASLLLIGLLSLPGCTNPPAGRGTAGAEKEIRDRWDQFISHWEAEKSDQLAHLYTEDAINVPPGFPANEGREAIVSFYRMLFDAHASSQYDHQIRSLDYASDRAVEYGEFTVNWVRNDGSTWTYRARSVTHWVQEEDEWRIKLFLFNQPPEESPD